MDKINIVNLQAVLKTSNSTNTRSMSSSLLVNSLVKNQLFKTAPDIDEPLFRFIHTMDLSVVDTMLHDSQDLVIHRTETWAVWRPQDIQVGPKTFGVSWHNSSTVARVQRSVLVHCPAGTQSRYQTLCVYSSWQQCDVIMMSRSSIEEISPELSPEFSAL